METMRKGIQNLKPSEKEEVLRNRFQNESKIWRRVVLKVHHLRLAMTFKQCLAILRESEKRFALYQRYQQFEEVERERFLLALLGKELFEARKTGSRNCKCMAKRWKKNATLSIDEVEGR